MITLRVVGLLYLISGLWCALNAGLAGRYVGYDMSSDIAQAEFVTVYGGLQVGLGIAMILGSLKKAAITGTLLVAFVFSFTLAAARLISVTMYPSIIAETGVWFMAKLEIAMAIALGFAFYRNGNKVVAPQGTMIAQ